MDKNRESRRVVAVLGFPIPRRTTSWGGAMEWTGLLSPLLPLCPPLSLQNSYTCACLASGSVLRLVDAVLGNEIRNGMAIIR